MKIAEWLFAGSPVVSHGGVRIVWFTLKKDTKTLCFSPTRCIAPNVMPEMTPTHVFQSCLLPQNLAPVNAEENDLHSDIVAHIPR